MDPHTLTHTDTHTPTACLAPLIEWVICISRGFLEGNAMGKPGSALACFAKQEMPCSSHTQEHEIKVTALIILYIQLCPCIERNH